MVVFVNPKSILYVKRRLLRKHGGSGVALLVGIVPEAFIALRGEVDLSGLKFRLLKAEYICVQRGECLGKALGHAGAQTVDVP